MPWELGPVDKGHPCPKRLPVPLPYCLFSWVLCFLLSKWVTILQRQDSFAQLWRGRVPGRVTAGRGKDKDRDFPEQCLLSSSWNHQFNLRTPKPGSDNCSPCRLGQAVLPH